MLYGKGRPAGDVSQAQGESDRLDNGFRCCICIVSVLARPDHGLIGRYYKSAGMIIVEVDREVTRIEDVLGMHSWSEFLLAPAAEEAGKSSEVFFCTYNTNKDVKNGGGYTHTRSNANDPTGRHRRRQGGIA